MPSPSSSSSQRAGFLLLIALIALAAGAKSILYDTLDPDCFWHLRVGEQLAREGIHPLHDSLSFASIREAWTPYSWLAELGMSKLWSLGGFRAAVLAAAMMISVLIGVITLASRELVAGHADESGNRYLATVMSTGFAAFLALPYLSFRPVAAALLLLAVCTWLMLRDRRLGERSRGVWWVILLTALTVNLHLFAGLVPLWLGALFLGAIWERSDDRGRRVGRYALLCGMSAAACACTPMLRGMLETIRHYSLHDPMVASTVIGEMQPFWRGGMGKISLALVGIFGVCVVRHRERLRAGEMLWLLLSFVMLLRMGRFAPVFALIAAPIFAVTMPRLSDAVLGRRPLCGAMAVILVAGVVRISIAFPSRAANLGDWLNRNGPDAPGYPVEAAAFVAESIPRSDGRIINEFNWGGYLAWKLGDHFQVLLDGRTQVFSPQFWQTVYLGDDEPQRRFLASVHADAAVLPVSKSRFKSTLVSLGWKTVHRDDRAEVMVPGESQRGEARLSD